MRGPGGAPNIELPRVLFLVAGFGAPAMRVHVPNRLERAARAVCTRARDAWLRPAIGTAVRSSGWEPRPPTETALMVQRQGGNNGDNGSGSWSFRPSPMWLPELATPLITARTAAFLSIVPLPSETTLDIGHGGASGAARQHCPERSGTAPMHLDSTKKKRAKKMKKHQLKKRRKRDRAKNRAK